MARRALSIGLVAVLAACTTPGPRPPSPHGTEDTSPVEGAPPVASAPSPYAGTSLPVPPKQLDPWQPPRATELPPTLIAAVVALFRDGLADPRGLEYRDVEIRTRSVWGN